MKSTIYELTKNKFNIVSKNLLILVGTLLCFGSAIAQTSTLDRQLQNVNQSTVTSGIIYNRSTPLADLCVYNMPDEKTQLNFHDKQLI